MNKKLLIGAALLAIGYFSFDYIAAARIGYLSLSCTTDSDLKNISADSKLSVNEQLKITSKIYACAREKQSSFERLIIKVPENWINPPVVYQ